MLEDYLRQVASDSPILAVALPHWGEAMLGCFAFEAKVRLLAGKFFLGESVKREIGDPKEGLLTLLFNKLDFTDDEQKFFRVCNNLRNKLIHCEPDAVQRLVTELVPTFRPMATVYRFKVPESGLTASIIRNAAENHTGGLPVVDTVSRQDGFAGWLLQAGRDGTFDAAAWAFQAAVAIISAKAAQEPKS
jgi:hypothetical protein